VHGLEGEYWGKVDFVYLDREDPANMEVVQRFGVTYQPVFILLQPNGAEVQRWFYITADELRFSLNDYLLAYPG